MTNHENGFCPKHWEMMGQCDLFSARVWVGCLKGGISLFQEGNYDQAEVQLTRAFIAGQVFCEKHEVTIDALNVLTDTAAVLHLCLIEQADPHNAAEVVASAIDKLAYYSSSPGLRSSAMHACNHLLSLEECQSDSLEPKIRLEMCRYVENYQATAH